MEKASQRANEIEKCIKFYPIRRASSQSLNYKTITQSIVNSGSVKSKIFTTSNSPSPTMNCPTRSTIDLQISSSSIQCHYYRNRGHIVSRCPQCVVTDLAGIA